MTTASRIHGALLGTLLGDAFGRPFEGIAPGDARSSGAIRARAADPRSWDYSDDGEMALAVAESIVRRRRVDESHLLATLAARHDVARGYGKGMRAAFRSLEITGDWRASMVERRSPTTGSRRCRRTRPDEPPSWRTSWRVAAAGPWPSGAGGFDGVTVAASADEDRAWFETEGETAWIVVADGAGGLGRGAEAADLVLQEVRAARPCSGRSMVRLLESIDRQLARRASGLTTAMVVHLDDARVLGASVGDGVVWALGGSGCHELTDPRSRRPLVGSGRAVPVPFVQSRVERILVATDGLASYLPPATVEGWLERGPSASAVVDAVRLPSGGLRDDTTVVLAERS